MYNYYVSYICRNKKDQQGAGFACIERQNPVKTMEDVLRMSVDIKKNQKLASVTIINWVLMES